MVNIKYQFRIKVQTIFSTISQENINREIWEGRIIQNWGTFRIFILQLLPISIILDKTIESNNFKISESPLKISYVEDYDFIILWREGGGGS